MKNTELINKVSRSLSKASFKLKKYSPEILVVAGVVGTVASTVLACRATTKVSAIIDKTKEDVELIHYSVEHPETLTEEYTVEDSKKDLAIIYTRTGVDLVKLYAPAVVLGAVSITSILASHKILRTRNLAMAAAYTTLNKSFKEYRNRVVDRFSAELDKELRYNIKAKEVEETIVDEKGKEKKVKKTVNVVDPNLNSDYARFFDDGCKGWDKNSEFNLMFLNHTQNYANDLLKSRGYLFLNEVYEMLGIPKTKAGQIVGWIYDEEHPIGDNFVDFGIYNIHNEKARDFVNGYEKTILLDFNVDGDILDMI